MGKDSKIEWTHHTFNPWWGCLKISPACKNCYAEKWAKRTGNDVWGKDAPRRFFTDNHWKQPERWNKQAEKDGVRRRVFCASMADVFEDRADLIEPRRRLFELFVRTPQLDWMLLTKRPENIARLTMEATGKILWGKYKHHFPNVWLGTTTENQKYYDQNWPEILSITPNIRFISAEPMLGPIRLSPTIPRPDLVICGGESGPGSRPMNPKWARSLREQCHAYDIPFFFKQWGAFDANGNRVGKKEGGRLLDGQLHQEMPDAS